MTVTIPSVWTSLGLPQLAGLRALAFGPEGKLYAAARGATASLSAVEPGGPMQSLSKVTIPGAPVAGADTRLLMTDLGQGPVALVTGAAGSGVLAYSVLPDGRLAPTPVAAGAQAMPQTVALLHAVTVEGQVRVYGATAGGESLLGWTGAGGRLTGMTETPAGLTPGGSGITGLADFAFAGSQWLLASSGGAEALLGFRLLADGTPVAAGQVAVAEGLGIAGASAVAAAVIGGRAYAVVLAAGSHSLSVFEMDATGAFSATDHVIDTLETRFQGGAVLALGEHGGAVYLAASGSDAGLSVFQLLPGGRLLHLLSLADTAATGLAGITGLAFGMRDGSFGLAAVSGTEAGITWIGLPTGPAGQVAAPEAGGRIDGTTGDDILAGGPGPDDLRGGAGADILMDGAGADLLTGGPGADVFVLSADLSRDRILDFQPGEDRLDLSGWPLLRSAAQLAITPTPTGAEIRFGGEVLELVSATGQGLTAAQVRAALMTGPDRFLPWWFDPGVLETRSETLPGQPGGLVRAGGPGDDRLEGGPGDDLLTGGPGNDTLTGNGGDDVLDGGPGADAMTGGPGSDIYHVDDAGDRITEKGAWAGTDTVIASLDWRLEGAHLENLTLTGTAITGIGNNLDNLLVGNDMNNVLDGKKGADTHIGGKGNDTYVVQSAADRVIELPGEGTDNVRAYLSYALPDNVERLYLQPMYRPADGTPVQGMTGVGNALDNLIYGTIHDNTLIGREGNDTLRGLGGADRFVFDRAPGPGNVDRILDFNLNGPDEGDLLVLRTAVFKGTKAGGLDAGQLAHGTAAQEADDRFVFDPGGGRLWFDPDGSGPAAQVLMATFDGGAMLHAADFLFV